MSRYNKFTLGDRKRARPIPRMSAAKVMTAEKTMSLESVVAAMQQQGYQEAQDEATKEQQDKVIEAAKNAWEVYNHSFRTFLLQCLTDRGVAFHDNAQFEQFVEAHITCANHEGTTNNSVYLDFADIDNRGDLLFTYSSAVSTEIDPETGEINIKIG